MNKSRFETFVEEFKKDPDNYQKKLFADGSFAYSEQVDNLIEFANKVNYNLFVYLFEHQLGEHLATKFIEENNRNLLSFFSRIDSQYRFFILYEIKNNKNLYFHCI